MRHSITGKQRRFLTHTLYMLAFTYDEIARATGADVVTVRRIVNDVPKVFEQAREKHGRARFPHTLMHWLALRDIDEAGLEPILRDWLKIDELNAFCLGAEGVGIALMQRPERQMPYVRLLSKIFVTELEALVRLLDRHDPASKQSAMLEDYFRNLMSGLVLVSVPTSVTEIRKAVTERTACMAYLHFPVWPDDAERQIDRFIAQLDRDQPRVLRMRYGIGQEALTEEAIARQLGTSVAKIRDIEYDAMRKLRVQASRHRLRLIIDPTCAWRHELDRQTYDALPAEQRALREDEAPMLRTIAEFKLTKRTANFLKCEDIEFVGELVELSEAYLSGWQKDARKIFAEIKAVILKPLGLTPGITIDDVTRLRIRVARGGMGRSR